MNHFTDKTSILPIWDHREKSFDSTEVKSLQFEIRWTGLPASAIMRRKGVKHERRGGVSRFVIHGGRPLQGEIRASGSKNAVLPMIAAALLTDEEVVLENVPSIRDVDVMLEINDGVKLVEGWLAYPIAHE